jgi:hypothetical protein
LAEAKVRVGGLDRTGDAIDLVATAIDVLVRVVEHAVFSENLVDRSAPAQRVVLTENVVKIE